MQKLFRAGPIRQGKTVSMAALVAILAYCGWLFPLSPRAIWTVSDPPETTEWPPWPITYSSLGIHATSFSPDGSILVTEEERYTNDGARRPCNQPPRLWNVATAQELAHLEDPKHQLAERPWGMQISHNNRWLALNTGRAALLVYEIASGQRLFESEITIQTWPSNGRDWYAIPDTRHYAFTPSGDVLVFAGEKLGRRGVLLLDPVHRAELCFLPDQTGPLAFSTDGRLLATCDAANRSVNVWNVSDITLVAKLSGVNAQVTHLSYSADNSNLLVISASWRYEFVNINAHERFQVTILELGTARQRQFEHIARLLAVIRDGPSKGPVLVETYPIQIGGASSQRLVIVDATTNQWCWNTIDETIEPFHRRTLKNQKYQTERIPVADDNRLSSDWRWLMKTDRRYHGAPGPLHKLPYWLTSFVWKSYQYRHVDIVDTATGLPAMSLTSNCGEPLFSPDGKTLVTGGDDGKSLYFWDVPPRRHTGAFFGGAIVGLIMIAALHLRRRLQARKRRSPNIANSPGNVEQILSSPPKGEAAPA